MGDHGDRPVGVVGREGLAAGAAVAAALGAAVATALVAALAVAPVLAVALATAPAPGAPLAIAGVSALRPDGARRGEREGSRASWRSDAHVVSAGGARLYLPLLNNVDDAPASGEVPGDLVLAENGVARAVIVLAEDASPTERTAAGELSKVLEEITGAQFRTSTSGEGGQMRVLVGPSPAARELVGDAAVSALGPDAYIVRSVGRDLLLVGGRPRGTLYAVYSFLEDDLGCRWTTWYGDESLPRRRRLTVPVLRRQEAPAFAERDLYTLHYSDLGAKKRFLVRNRVQGPTLGLLGDLDAQGGTSRRLGFAPGGGTVHTLFEWMPPEEHFAEHPDWYSLVGDARVPTRQLCFTNRGLRAALTEAVLQRIGASDSGAMYSVSAMDVPGPLCDCEQCRALVEREGTPGAPLFDYLRELGAQVQQRYPGAAISTLAYRKDQSEAPPRSIALPDNVVVTFAPIDADFAASLDAPSNAGTRRNLEDWSRATAHLWVWYYPNTYGTALPMGNLHRLARDFRLFERLGVEGLFVEQDAPGAYDSRRLADLQSWLITKLMWEPDRDLDTLVAEFTDSHYGPAAPEIRRYVADLEGATSALQTPMSWAASAGQHRALSPALLLESQRTFDRAEAAAGGDPVILSRVRQARMSLDHACVQKWSEIAVAGRGGLTLRGVATRYRTTYAETAASRLLAPYGPDLVRALDDWLLWYERLEPPRPLPPPLDAVPADRVRQFTPESARLSGPAPELVEDAGAAAGIAVAMTPTLDPAYAPNDVPPNALNMGFYDVTTGRQQHAFAGKDAALTPGDYDLYPIGRTALSADAYVWLDWSWRIQFADVPALYEPEDPDREWDVYASLRFEGPAYDPGAEAGENRFFVDRIVLVRIPD